MKASGGWRGLMQAYATARADFALTRGLGGRKAPASPGEGA